MKGTEMKAATSLVFVAALLAVMVPVGATSAQTPQVTPPEDPKTKPPQSELDEVRELLACDCGSECCARTKAFLKKHYKRQLKDPNAKPMLAPERKVLKHRSRGRRARSRRSLGIDWSRPRPPTRSRWLDAAHAHKLRKARWAKRKAAGRLELTDEQREKMRDLRYQQQQEMIDLEAVLEKRRLELKRLMRDGDASEGDVRRLVDSIAEIRADIQFLQLKGRLDKRALLSDEQRGKLKRRR
jgi:Spy/CpxP family protein refolding chaperone